MTSDTPRQAVPYQRPFEQVLGALNTDARRGLTGDEVARPARTLRPERTDAGAAGPGVAEVPRAVPGRRWSSCSWSRPRFRPALWLYERDSPLPYEAIAISAVVLLNAVMGYVQESRAESAVAALRQMAAAHAHVIRDGDGDERRRRRAGARRHHRRRGRRHRFRPMRG